jgi:hypothetical protein
VVEVEHTTHRIERDVVQAPACTRMQKNLYKRIGVFFLTLLKTCVKTNFGISLGVSCISTDVNADPDPKIITWPDADVTLDPGLAIIK